LALGRGGGKGRVKGVGDKGRGWGAGPVKDVEGVRGKGIGNQRGREKRVKG